MPETKNVYSENLLLLGQYKSGSRDALEKLTKINSGLVTSIAVRFTSRGYELEDLIETGMIGLIKAINGFDETQGHSFSTYAFPFIAGEIKRLLRDSGPIKVSRSDKSNSLIVSRARENFIKQNGREPRINELCSLTGMSREDTVSAIEVLTPPLSLDEKISEGLGDMTLGDTIADTDCFEAVTNKLALRQAIYTLSARQRQIVELRFFRNLTQEATAKLLGVSQVTVSREEKKIIDKLRQEIL